MGDSQEPAPDTGRRIFRDAALERLNSPEQLTCPRVFGPRIT